MTKLMYDSTTPAAIPTDAPVVAGYADGRFQWSSADWARFPNSIAVSIACFPASSADILDIEAGCAGASDVPGWLDRYNRPLFKVPTLYSSRGLNYATIKAILAAAQGRPFDWWAATLDGTQVLPDAPIQPVAVQYCGAAGSGDLCQSAGAYDLSLCQDFWPRLPALLPPPVPGFLTGKGDHVFTIVFQTNHHVFWVDGQGRLRHLFYPDQPLAGSTWNAETLTPAGTLLGNGHVTGEIFVGQLHIYAPTPDGRMLHMFQAQAQPGQWNQEILA